MFVKMTHTTHTHTHTHTKNKNNNNNNTTQWVINDKKELIPRNWFPLQGERVAPNKNKKKNVVFIILIRSTLAAGIVWARLLEKLEKEAKRR